MSKVFCLCHTKEITRAEDPCLGDDFKYVLQVHMPPHIILKNMVRIGASIGTELSNIPAQLYFQHQGLEYTSVEAFENLMRATVIAFMARSASDLCVLVGGSDMHINFCSCMFLLGVQSIKYVSDVSGNGVRCCLVCVCMCEVWHILLGVTQNSRNLNMPGVVCGPTGHGWK